METRRVECPGNEALAAFLVQKREEHLEKSYSEGLDATFLGAHRSVCEARQPILSLREASKIKGFGKWLLKLLAEYFSKQREQEQPSGAADTRPKGKQPKAPRRYLPQKNSAPYAILITLCRAMQEGKVYMMRHELIDAAEASGLSRLPIEPNKGVVPPRFGSGPQYSYSGWNSMKTLIEKGLVIKKNNPAKYMLTDMGKTTAQDCMVRSGLGAEKDPSQGSPMEEDMERDEGCRQESLGEQDARGPQHSSSIQRGSQHATVGSFSERDTILEMNRLKSMGFKEPEIRVALQRATGEGLPDKDLWAHALEFLLGKRCGSRVEKDRTPTVTPSERGAATANGTWYRSAPAASKEPAMPTYTGPASSRTGEGEASTLGGSELAVPPLDVGESFVQVYDMVLILDAREQIRRNAQGTGGSLQKFADRLRDQYNVNVEIRQLPVGDATWIARHKQRDQEYVLDFIVERKRVDDLWQSIKDTRYKQQKLRLLRCGLKRLIYLVEGDPNLTDAAENLKTATFTTEILEGFDVQRTRDANDTLARYGELTLAITDRYSMEFGTPGARLSTVCQTFKDFVEHCKELEMERISDVFGVQLMQVRSVTEDMALSILDRYPTLLSLAQAYSKLEGDLAAQEQLLKDIPIRNKNKTIGSNISKKIYRLLWAP